MDTLETEGPKVEPRTTAATVSLWTGITAAAVYFAANSLLYVVPFDLWLPPNPATGIALYFGLPLLLCAVVVVVGIVAIGTGWAALKRPVARARAGAGVALGIASTAQALMFALQLNSSLMP